MKIGTEELVVTRESKRALDIEVVLRNVLVYAVILLYALDYIGAGLFFVLLYLSYARYFIANHDRFHADYSKRLPRPAELFTEYFAVIATPWVEPYDSVRWKHLKHHATHSPGKVPALDMRNDPQSAFEMGGILRAFLSSVFYEEVQLLRDIRYGQISQSRWINLAIYLPLQILFVAEFGWQKYLLVVLALRFTGGISWFLFSWGLHTPFVYRFGFVHKVPLPIRLLVGLSNGNRTMIGVFHHTTHHAWPGLASREQDKLDSAVLRNPDAAPNMIPSATLA